MKKLLALALLSSSLLAVDTSQMKLKTDGGAQGDASKALVVAIARGTTAPASPVTGQLWLDTNYSPAILKDWNGSAWVAPQQNASVQTRVDVTSFPGSPVDGQLFYSKSPRGLYIYDSTLGQWVTFITPMLATGPNIIDTYTNAVMTPPTGAIVATNSATAGSTGAGSYSWRVTCRNALGGETTAGATSNVITPGVSKSADLASIPLCSTATGPTPTNRNIYRTITTQGVTGPWYYVGNLADNTTTTYHDGALDGLGLAPDVNFSAAPPGSWTALNVGLTGGCGGTGATRGSFACYNGALATVGFASAGSESGLRASLSIASYTTGSFTMQYRVTKISRNGDTYPTTADSCFLGLRNGTADNATRIMFSVSSAAMQTILPFSSSVHGSFSKAERITVGGTPAAALISNLWPQLDAFPFWVRWVRRGTSVMSYMSQDGVTWVESLQCTGTNNTTALCSLTQATFGATGMDHVEIPVSSSFAVSAAGNGPWVEVDSFSLVVQ